MDKTAIKNFSIWARNTLMNDVRTRLGMIGITENGINSPLPASTREIQYFDVGSAQPSSITGNDITSRENIVSRLKQDKDYSVAYNQLIETTASSWFNRLIAIRFMEVNDHFDDGLRVLSSSTGLKDPDLLTNPFDSDLEFSERERAKVRELMNDNQMDDLFRFLLFKRCNQLHKVLPGLFERSGDSSEFLIKLSYIDRDGMIYHLISDINEEDWLDQVQIIGWMYQYYNSELKDETFALLKKNQKITKERVPSATQLFTPDWIVRYMVENTLGRLWIEGHPEDSHLKENWKYYLEEAEQDLEVQKQLEIIRHEYNTLKPEDLLFIDPCMGSGHILVYAFDVLMQIYETQGYTQRDAAQSILKNNLYGIDIDDRAYQLAYFAVMMKVKQFDRRILSRGILPKVFSIQESNTINRNQLSFFGAALSEKEKRRALNEINKLLDSFIDAKEYGSILNVNIYDWTLLKDFVEDINITQLSAETVGIDETQEKLIKIIELAEIMTMKYSAVVTNPPYMSGSGMAPKLSDFVRKHYMNTKADMSTVFMEKTIDMCCPNGFMAMINIPVWMSLPTYTTFRTQLLRNYTFVSMSHNGRGIFGSDFGSTAFVIRKSKPNSYKGVYARLFIEKGQVDSVEEKEKMFLECFNRYEFKQCECFDIPDMPLAYWETSKAISVFKNKKLGETLYAKTGVTTGDNEAFLRLWYEISLDKWRIKWFPLNKGGEYHKWYGNNEYVIDWENNGAHIKSFPGSTIRNEDFFFREGVTWSKITAAKFSARLSPAINMFDAVGLTCFSDGKISTEYILAYFCSKIVEKYVKILNQTVSYTVGTVNNLPFVYDDQWKDQIADLSYECINIAKKDWDSFETSWDFKTHPFLEIDRKYARDNGAYYVAEKAYMYDEGPKPSCPVEACFFLWQGECNYRFWKLKQNEEELNRIFINIYGLQDELSPEVEDKDVTVSNANLKREIESLISYAIGCIFGRYSLDTDGLAYAGGEWNPSKYRKFIPDADNIIPITDEKYLPDDLAERFFDWVSIVFGKELLSENLQYIADALGGKGNSKEIIRSYLVNDFFKDHCSTYSVTGSGKRPIYWLFDSGKKNGFKALIYMHRYTPDTIGRVRVNYLHKIQEKYENEVRAIETFVNSSSDQKMISRETKRMEKLLKQIEEVKAYDEKLEHLAAENIEIDLDDGVKKNYEKIQTDRNGKKYQILAPIK